MTPKEHPSVTEACGAPTNSSADNQTPKPMTEEDLARERLDRAYAKLFNPLDRDPDAEAYRKAFRMPDP